jgi:tetratricopeptide (TPR) repeat protein
VRTVRTREESARWREFATAGGTAIAGAVALGLVLSGDVSVGAGSFGFAVATGILAAVFLLPQWLAEKRHEKVDREAQLKVAIGPVADIDPTRIGVDPAAREETHLETDVSDYVTRDADRELHQALCEALDGKGRGLVVVVGPPAVGKSRTLFEGVRRLDAEGRGLHLVAPVDTAAARSVFERVEGDGAKTKGPRYVLWLDDLEVFVAGDLAVKDLMAWQEKGAIVVATYGGKARERKFGEQSDGATAKLMSHARQVGLQATTVAEVANLPLSLAKVDRKAIEDYGLAAALVAAPRLELKLKAQSGGSEAGAVGAAIVYTAINWARTSRTDPITKELLRELWPTHLRGITIAATDGIFEAGLDWACEPVVGGVGLLRGVDSFRVYDYIRAAAERDPATPPISDETWRRAGEITDPGQALVFGNAALVAGRTSEAEQALELAGSQGEAAIAAEANLGLARLRDESGDEAGARLAIAQASRLGAVEALVPEALLTTPRVESGREEEERLAAEEVAGPPPQVRAEIERDVLEKHPGAEIKWKEELYREEVEAGNGEAAETLGLALSYEGKPREAEQMFRKAIESGHTRATVPLGLLLEDLGDLEGAEGAYREAVEHGYEDGAFNLGLLLKEKGDLAGSEEALALAAAEGYPQAANNLGILLEQRGDLSGAEGAYRQAVALGFWPAAPALGGLLARMGRMDEAEEIFRQAAEVGDMGGAVALARLLVERGDVEGAREAFRPYARENGTDELLLVATLLEELGYLEAAVAAYREAAERGVGVAAFNLSRVLEQLGQDAEAAAAFAQAERLEAEEGAESS